MARRRLVPLIQPLDERIVPAVMADVGIASIAVLVQVNDSTQNASDGVATPPIAQPIDQLS